MGIREDRSELFGSPLEKKIQWMRESGGIGWFIRDEDSQWVEHGSTPNTGTPYIEVMSDGEVRSYQNNGNQQYQRMHGTYKG